MHDIGVIPIDYQLPTQDCETLKSVRLPIFKDSLVNIFSSPNLFQIYIPMEHMSYDMKELNNHP
jgi:hypothetical protein